MGTVGAGSSRAVRVAALLACLVVAVQIAYPLLDGDALTAATIGAVVLFAAASLTHAAAVFGPRTAVAVLVAAGGLGLLAEAVGIRTGFPFGEYAYTDGLGVQVLGVPVVVPLAWTMMAYPCLLLGRLLSARPTRTALLGGLTLAAWDLYLDPQMVGAGHWIWAWPDPHLPGVPDIPLTNYAGWVLVGVSMVAVLDRVVPTAPRTTPVATVHAVPAALLTWTWLGSAVANLAFFDRPVVALYGGPAMAATMVPYLLRLRRIRRQARRRSTAPAAPGLPSPSPAVEPAT